MTCAAADRASRFLVLAGGQVEALATQDELMRQRGRHAELFKLQAVGLR